MKKSFLAILVFLSAALGSVAGVPVNQPAAVNSKPIYLTKSEFIKRVMDYEKNKTEWVYKGDKPAIIDFYADWCGPCKKVAPVLEELAGTYAGKVYIYKVNIDKEPELAGLFGVRNIPTFLIIPMKGKPQISSGASANFDENKTRFKQIIDDVLLK
ncbi:MAG: thiol reductase thioredoxin [Porphyromonadaceae bacterium]|nr:MAG: thiol reductase thioredoxin [Porphyromonadaceae bacterium]